jgi:hypothetical protein
LRVIKETGFCEWSTHSYRTRDLYVDSLVLLAQKRLRSLGVKYSEMAEFFAVPSMRNAFLVKH